MNRERKKLRAIHFRRFAPALAMIVIATLASCNGRSGFNNADTDKSGSVTPAEFERYMLEAIFAESDANGDARVTFPEWKAANPDAEEWKFRTPDTNRDGAVTPAEAKSHFTRQGTMSDLFAQIDTNHDGVLSWEEVKQFRKKLKSQTGTPLQKLSNSVSSSK